MIFESDRDGPWRPQQICDFACWEKRTNLSRNNFHNDQGRLPNQKAKKTTNDVRRTQQSIQNAAKGRLWQQNNEPDTGEEFSQGKKSKVCQKQAQDMPQSLHQESHRYAELDERCAIHSERQVQVFAHSYAAQLHADVCSRSTRTTGSPRHWGKTNLFLGRQQPLAALVEQTKIEDCWLWHICRAFIGSWCCVYEIHGSKNHVRIQGCNDVQKISGLRLQIQEKRPWPLGGAGLDQGVHVWPLLKPFERAQLRRR